MAGKILMRSSGYWECLGKGTLDMAEMRLVDPSERHVCKDFCKETFLPDTLRSLESFPHKICSVFAPPDYKKKSRRTNHSI